MQNRRTYLGLIASGLVTAVAGCSGNETETSTETETEQVTDTAATTEASMETPPEPAYGPDRTAKLGAADGEAGDHFGLVTLSGNGSTATIGSNPQEDKGGSAYVFTQEGGSWNQQSKLTIEKDDMSSFAMESAVDEAGDTALITALNSDDPEEKDPDGFVYAYSRSGDTWSRQVELVADDGDRNDWFGTAIALSADGTTALVGAPTGKNSNGDTTGAAYVFSQSGSSGSWSQEAKLVAEDGDQGDQFGLSVALSNDGSTALIGTSDEDPNGKSAGAAYAFARDGGDWRQDSKLVAGDGGSGDNFGISVSLNGDGTTALIGAAGDDSDGFPGTGSAYVFSRADGSWSQMTKLTGSYNEGLFGLSVALSGDVALIGQPMGRDTGRAHAFVRIDDSWSKAAEFFPKDGEAGDQFGAAVSLTTDGSTALIGAPDATNPNGIPAGAAYVFKTTTK